MYPMGSFRPRFPGVTRAATDLGRGASGGFWRPPAVVRIARCDPAARSRASGARGGLTGEQGGTAARRAVGPGGSALVIRRDAADLHRRRVNVQGLVVVPGAGRLGQFLADGPGAVLGGVERTRWPDGVLVLSEAGGARLVWNPSLAGDLASYRVYRREKDGWKRIADGLKDPVYFDAEAIGGGAAPALVRAYAVTAVDKSGNESPMGFAK